MFGSNDKKVNDSVSVKEFEAEAFVLSENSVVNGNVTTNEPTTIEGTVEGNVTIENSLVLGAKGVISGPVYAQISAKINGAVTGDLTCKGPVYLSATAKMTGDVQCTSLTIEPGAYFCGKVVCAEIK